MESQYRRKPTLKEMEDYDNDILTAIRLSDLNKLKSMKEDGRTLTACNRYGESIVHMACRRSDFNIVEYVLDNIEEQCLIDDYGRTPLHDACWRSEPRFDIVTLLLDKNINLLRFQDVRGSNPLNYVREEHWLQWCAYFFHQKDKYWKI
jgi:ankyrin repeat protein